MKTNLLAWTLLFTILSLSCRERGATTDKNPNPSPTGVITNDPKTMDFVKGSGNVTVEYFADLECGACKAIAPVLDQILKKYPNKMRLVFKNYPKDKSCSDYDGEWQKQHSCEAHVAARCVGLIKNKFWEFKEFLFARQNQYSTAKFKTWAMGSPFNLTAAEFDNCHNDPTVMAKIKADINEGNNRGVNGTPTIYVNRLMMTDNSQQAIEAEINKY